MVVGFFSPGMEFGSLVWPMILGHAHNYTQVYSVDTKIHMATSINPRV